MAKKNDGGEATPTYVANPATGHWEQAPPEPAPKPPEPAPELQLERVAADFRALIRISVLEDALRPIAALRDEALFTLGKGGIEGRAVDAAHVALAIVKLQPNAFEKFKGKKDGSFAMVVDDLWTALKHANKTPDQFAWLEVADGKIRLAYGRHSYQANQADLTPAYWPKIPQLATALPATLSVGRFDYVRTLQALSDITDHVRQSATAEEGFKVCGEDGDGHSWTSIWPDKEAIVKLDGPAKSIHPLDYLQFIVNSIPHSCTHVTLKLGVDYPVTLAWPITKAQKTVGDVLCMLAPRIESE